MLPSQTLQALPSGSTTLGLSKASHSGQPTVSDLDHGSESFTPDRYIKSSHQGASNANISTHLSLQALHTEVDDFLQFSLITQQQAAGINIDSPPIYIKCMDKESQRQEMEENMRAKIIVTEVPLTDEDEDNKYTEMTAIGMIKSTLSEDSSDHGQ